jgi:hypothetical protein
MAFKNKVIRTSKDPVGLKNRKPVTRSDIISDDPSSWIRENLRDTFKTNIFEGKTEFTGRVLLPLNPENMEDSSWAWSLGSMLKAALSGENGALTSAYIVRCEGTPQNPSLHDWIPDPDNYPPGSAFRDFLISLHPVMEIASFEDLGHMKDLSIGSLVSVSFTDINYLVGNITKVIYNHNDPLGDQAFTSAMAAHSDGVLQTSANIQITQDEQATFDQFRASPHFEGVSDEAVAALVANAKAESDLCSGNAGDLRENVGGNGEYAIHATNCDGREGDYCSFGYFQLNVCADGGEGQLFAEYFEIELTEKEELYDALMDEDKQLEFAASRLKEILGDDADNSAIDGKDSAGTAAYVAGEWAAKFENCVGCQSGQGENRSRQTRAAALMTNRSQEQATDRAEASGMTQAG